MGDTIDVSIEADERRNEARKLRVKVKAAKEKRDQKAAEVERYKSARNVWPEDSQNYQAQNMQVENHSEILARYEQELQDLELACSRVGCTSTDQQQEPVKPGASLKASDTTTDPTTDPIATPTTTTTTTMAENEFLGLPWWAFAIGAALLVLVVGLVYFFVIRNSGDAADTTETVESSVPPIAANTGTSATFGGATDTTF